MSFQIFNVLAFSSLLNTILALRRLPLHFAITVDITLIQRSVFGSYLSPHFRGELNFSPYQSGFPIFKTMKIVLNTFLQDAFVDDCNLIEVNFRPSPFYIGDCMIGNTDVMEFKLETHETKINLAALGMVGGVILFCAALYRWL